MALLSEQERFEVYSEAMEANTEEYSLLKAELRAVVDAADVFAEGNQGDFNASLPLPGRTALNAAQKTDAFARVIRKRHGAGI